MAPTDLIPQIAAKLRDAGLRSLSAIFARSSADSVDSAGVRDRNAAALNARLASGQPICIEFGETAKRLEGWLTADCGPGADIRLDLSRPLPIPTESVAKIYSSHLLEHLDFPDGLLQHLRECLRILKPGGTISVAAPNARIWIDAYLAGKIDEERYCGYKPAYAYFSSIDYINYVAYMGGAHRHLFDQDNLVAVLRGAGFETARARAFDQDIDLAERRDESVYAIATKA